MHNPFIAQIIFCIFIFSSCSEDNRDLIPERLLPLGEPIVGKPIIPVEANSTVKQQSLLQSDFKGEEANSSKFSN